MAGDRQPTLKAFLFNTKELLAQAQDNLELISSSA